MSYTAGNVMDTAASLMNDTAKTLYSYTVQLPYLKMVQQELEQELDLNEVPLNLTTEAAITVTSGSTTLTLPSDFFLPIRLQELPPGGTKVYVDMREVTNVTDLMLDPSTWTSLQYWDYRNNNINFLGAINDVQVKLDYWRFLPAVVDDTTPEIVAGANNFLSFRTAALLATYIGGAPAIQRATALTNDANNALGRLVSLLVKNNQGKRVRRRAFRVPGLYSRGIRVTVP